MTKIQIMLLTTVALGFACGDDVSPSDAPRKDDGRRDVKKNGPAHRDGPRMPGSGDERPRDSVATPKVDTKKDDTNKDDVRDEPAQPDGGKTPREPGAGAPTR